MDGDGDRARRPTLRARLPWRLLVVVALVATAVFLVRSTPLGDRLGPEALDDLAGTPWAAPALVGLYIVTFALAIPGSALFIAAGFVFPPPVAAALGVVGATTGSTIAYGIGNLLTGEARERWRRKPGFGLVERSLDFVGLLTLRLTPAFPHSLVNYGSGIAGARLGAFIPATIIGIGVKAFIYGKVAYEARRAGTAVEVMRADVWGLLLALALVSLGAKLLLRRRTNGAVPGGAAATPAP